jgi:hypothetical protein
MKVKPITPDNLQARKPYQIIETFNEFIQARWDGHRAKFEAKEIVTQICSRMKIPKTEVYDKHYLDIEPVFEEAGWKVEYHKPAYNEQHPFDPYFVFTLKDKR